MILGCLLAVKNKENQTILLFMKTFLLLLLLYYVWNQEENTFNVQSFSNYMNM